ncbi:MAG: hypothetical protein PHP28_03640 [Actinomycetota bacterium]|nr:hypothetical protein [Actinomycetota bacterium]MDD5667740.1 hypothetical protein [Actinomycetota bacterium]
MPEKTISRITFACVLALVILAFSLPAALAQTQTQDVQAVIAEVFEETVSVRGLDADPNIPVNYLTREELEARMLEDFAEDNPEEELEDAQGIMVMLGFIEPDLDLEDFYIAMLTEQIAGFYDPEDNGLYLISESQSMSAMDRYTLSHEFVHYLQDQNFDLMRPPFYDPDDIEVPTDDDSSFAATCLVEGDAVLTSENWLMAYMDAEDMMDMYSESEEYSSDILDSAPEYIYESLLFPYMEGADFVRYIYEEGGFDAIDKAFDNPPSTTEQIYHPEKYIEGEGAIEVELEDISSKLGGGWILDYENVLGEFDVYQLFAPYFSDIDDVETAAGGWGGNRYHYYTSGDGEELLVQAYAWDSEKDAQEFAAAYAQYLKGRFGGELEKEQPAGSWMIWSSDDYMLGLKRNGLNTELVQATATEPLEAAIAALGEEGDAIDEGALEVETDGEGEGETDLSVLIIALVIGLLALGIILVIVMLLMFRRSPPPPAQPPMGPSGPYYYGPPGGGSGGDAGPYAGGPGAGPPPPTPQGGQVPSPPTQAPPVPGTQEPRPPEATPGE